MTDETTGGIGGRVAALRKLGGLKQHQLAARAHVSISLVKKVEAGHAPASPAFTAACARALGVDVVTLTGQPYEDFVADHAVERAGIPELRRALDYYDNPQVDGPVWSAATLRARLDEGEGLRRRSQYSHLAERLPLLLHHLYAHALDVPAADREDANALLCDGYSLAQAVAYRLSHIDLAALAAERHAAIAKESGDPLREAVAVFCRSHLQLHRGDYDLAMRVIEKAQFASMEHANPVGLALSAQLHLRQAILAARSGKPDEADAHIAEARDIVTRNRVPVAPYFDIRANRSNVEIHSVAVPVEMLDGVTAVARAESVQLQLDDPAESTRVGHHYIDVARAWTLYGDRSRALKALHTARHISPQQTRYHPSVRETLHAIAAADRRSSESLTGFARWVGVSL